MSSPRVFVVQRVRHVSYKSGELEDKHDLRPAEKFGSLVYLLDSLSGRPSLPSFLFDVGKLSDELYNAQPNSADVLLPMGAPTLIGAATAIFTHLLGGKLRLLQWDQRRSDYVLMEACTICTTQGCIGHFDDPRED